MNCPLNAKDHIRQLADRYRGELKKRIDDRVHEMHSDDTSHFLIYRVLGVAENEGRLIDEYQNKGRFLYKYAGSFLEDAAKHCFRLRYPDSGSIRIPNTRGQRPRTFEVDCAVGKDALEIKWRDATTDGDHIIKENTRLQAMCDAGYKPVRVMFYYPNRDQAIRIRVHASKCTAGVPPARGRLAGREDEGGRDARGTLWATHLLTCTLRIQLALETLYKGAGGQYYYADAAWQFVKGRTGVDLKQILEELAQEKTQKK